MNDRTVTFSFDDKASRVDKFLVKCLPEHSRSQLLKWIKNGLVTVDARPVRKGGQIIETGAVVTVQIPPLRSSPLIPEAIPLDVVFENQDVLLVNKPAGMVVHPAAGHDSGTLVHAALAHCPDLPGIGGEQRPGIVHRLDKDTSGLIIMAKNDQTHRFLQEQFRQREVQKQYLALVDGAPPTPTGKVEASIGRDPRHRKRMAVVVPHKGRESVTEYVTLESFPRHTLLAVHPLTGRTHQIRIHMAFLGCPVVGDKVYGFRKPTLKIRRHFLHAERLTILLPGETAPRTFTAPLPDNLVHILETLRKNSS